MKKSFSAECKVKVALEAIRGVKSPSEIASAFQVHPTQIGFWKRQLIERAPTLFTDRRANDGKTQERLIEELYQTIGQRDMELAWLKKSLAAFDP
jgi:transposase-like protein